MKYLTWMHFDLKSDISHLAINVHIENGNEKLILYKTEEIA